MKNLRFFLPMLAIVLAVAASAFTAAPTSKPADPNDLYWFNADGTTYLNRVSTIEEEEDFTDCIGEDEVCERGYTQQQLVNGNPQNGVQEMYRESPTHELKEL